MNDMTPNTTTTEEPVKTANGHYQRFVADTAVFPPNFGIIYCALKLAGEAGEVVEKIGKLIRDAGALQQGDVIKLTPDQIAGVQEGGATTVELTIEQLLAVTPKLVLNDTQKLDLIKELGDVEWYLTALARELGTNKDAVIAVNVNKLRDRRARGVLKGSGDNR